MTSDKRTALTESGQARRDAMLETLIGEMHLMHVRRRRRRRALTVAAPVVLAAAALMVLGPWKNRGSQIAHNDTNIPAPTSPVIASNDEAISGTPLESDRGTNSCVNIEWVKTDPAIRQRYSIHATPRARRLNDQQLLEALSAIDRPAGLVRIEGRVWLTSNASNPDGGS